MDNFVQYMVHAKKAAPIEEDLKKQYNSIVDLADKIATEKYNKHFDTAARLEKKLKRLHDKAKATKKKYDDVVFRMIALFTSISPVVLASFETNERKEKNDNHFATYKNRLDMLISMPLPDESIRSFEFQGATDAEIDELKEEYKALSFFGKRTKSEKAKYKKYKAAKSTVYEVKDIWLQTTMANKYFQDKANEIVSQLQNDNYSGLPFLAALVTTEYNQDDAAMENIRNADNNAYLEKYRAEFLNVFKYRL